MIIELNPFEIAPPINEFLITPAYMSIKIHLNNHLGIEMGTEKLISCTNFIDYTPLQ